MYKTRSALLSSKLLTAIGLVAIVYSSFIAPDIGVVRALELATAMPATSVSVETVTPVVDTATPEPLATPTSTSTSEVLPPPVESATPIVETTQTGIPEISITATETAIPSESPTDQVGIQPLAANGSSFYYYADGNRIQLTPSLKWVSMKFASDDQMVQSTALQNYGAMVGPLEQARQIPNPKLTLLPLQEGLINRTLVQGINSLRINTASFLQVNPVFQTEDAEMAITNEFIATFPAGKSMEEIDAINSSYGVEMVEPILGQENTFVLRVSQSANIDSLSMANLYQESGAATHAAPNFVRIIMTSPSESQIKQAIAPMAAPNDDWYFDQWSLNNTGQYTGITVDADIDAPEAWDHTTGSSAVIIAVIDEGVDLTHEDLSAKLVTGYDATGGGSSGGPWGDDAHGTNVAGIAAASSNNTIGVAGVCQGCLIMPVRIAYSDIYGDWVTYDSWIANGITWAYVNGASILNNSWGGGSEVTVINTAIANAKSLGRGGKGSVVVFAAGNNNASSVSYPGYLSNVIAVGASNMCDQRKTPTYNICNGYEDFWGSNYGSALDISAPGVWLDSTDIMGAAGYNDGIDDGCVSGTDANYFLCMNGTSGATPIVSGVAGLVLSVNPNMTANQVQTILQNAADDVNGGGWDTTMGYGRVNANRAVVFAANNPPTDITLAPSAIGERAAANAVVGTLTTTDPESGTEAYTYSLVTAVGTGGGACAAGDSVNNTMFKVGLSGGNLDKIYTNATVTPGAKKICVRSTDNGAGSLYYTKAITITVNPAPTALVLGTPFINQGAAADTVVGTLTPTGGNGPYTYSLVANTTGGTGTCVTGVDNVNNASFKIGGASFDQILTNAVVATTGTKKICVRVTDSAVQAASYTKNITITVNAAPTNVALTSSGVMVGTLTDILVGTLTTTGGTAPYTYSLVTAIGTGGGTCAAGDSINNTMFQVGLSGDNLDKIYTNATVTTGIKKICVRATDNAVPAANYTKNLTIAVNNAPTNITLSASTVAENSAVGTAIGNLTTTDPDAGETFNYTLSNAAPTCDGSGVAADNGKVQIVTAALKVGGAIDYETQTILKICVQTTNAAFSADKFQKAFTITVTNANDAPTEITLGTPVINEGAAANTVVGALTTTDPDVGQTFTYSLVTAVGTGGGTCAAGDYANNTMFKVGTGGDLGKILVNTTVTSGAKKICVRSTDNGVGARYYTKAITITVNPAPTALVLGTPFINQGAAADTVVGTLTPTGGTSPYTYSLEMNTTGGTGTCAAGNAADNAMFKIGGGGSQILVNTTVTTSGAKKICMRVTDSASPAAYRTQAITITVNSAPTNVVLAPSGAIVGTLTNIVVGTLTTTGGTGPTITYTLANNATGGMGACINGTDDVDNASFQVGAGVDANKILTNATVTTGPKKICVRATDSATPAAYYTKALTITANNTPTDITLSTSTVIQNSPLNTQVATLTTTDVDPADTFTYSLVTDVGTCGGDGGVAGNAFFKIGTGANADKLLVNTPPTSGNKDICLRSTDNGIPNAYYTKAITIIVTPVWSLSGTVSFTACPTLKLGGGLVATFGAKTGAVNFVDGTYSIDNVVDHAAGTVTITQPSDGYTFSAGIPITDVDSDKTGNNFTAVGTRTISGTFTGPAAYGSPRVPADGATGATVTLANCVIFSVPANGTSATTAFTISGLPAKAFVLHPLYGKGALVANPIATPFTPANLYGNTTYGNIAGKAFTFTWNNFTIGGSAKNNYGANLTGATTVTLVGTGEFAGVNSTGTAATAGLWSAFSPFRKPASGVNDPQPYTANIIFANPNYQDFVLGTSNPQTFDNNKTNNVTGYGSAAIFGTIGGYLPEGTVVNFGGGLISNIEDAGQFLISELEPKSYTLLPTATGIYFTNSATTYTAATSRSILATAAGAELNMWYGWDLANLPYPTAPANNAIVPLADPKSPTFNWTAVTGATSYDVQVSTTSTFTAATTKTVRVTGELTYTPATGDIYNLITSGVKVYWGVKANGGAPGTSIYTHLVPGGVRAFTTNNLPPTIGLLTFAGNVATFNWTASQNAIATNKYMVEYNNSPTLAGTTTKLYAVFPAVIANTTIVTPPAKTYYFRVTLLNAANVPISVASAISVGVLH